MRRIAIVLIGLLALGACSSSNADSGKTKITGTTERSCTNQFEKYRDRYDTARFSSVDGAMEKALRELVETVAFCPSPAVWHKVGQSVDPDDLTKWSSRYSREATRKGMCDEFNESQYAPPACP